LGLYCNLFIAINDHCVIRSANISYSLAFSLDDKSLYQGEDVHTRIKKWIVLQIRSVTDQTM